MKGRLLMVVTHAILLNGLRNVDRATHGGKVQEERGGSIKKSDKLLRLRFKN